MEWFSFILFKAHSAEHHLVSVSTLDQLFLGAPEYWCDPVTGQGVKGKNRNEQGKRAEQSPSLFHTAVVIT